MSRPLLRRFVYGGVTLLIAGAGFLLGACWQSGVWTPQQYQIRGYMAHECHPVWHDLWHGRIAEGDDLESVIQLTQPAYVERYGRFTRLTFEKGLCFTGVAIWAKDGRLVRASAASCTWRHLFFDVMTAEDSSELNDAFAAFRRMKDAEIARWAAEKAASVLGLLGPPANADQLVCAAAMLPE